MPRFIKFACVGAFGFLVDSLCFFLFYEVLACTPFFARCLAFIFAATSTWLGNRYFTFSNGNVPTQAKQTIGKEWLRFMAVATFSLMPNLACFQLASIYCVRHGITIYVAFVLGVLTGMMSNYFLSAQFVFLRSRN